MKHLTKSLTLAGVAIAVATPALASSGAPAPAPSGGAGTVLTTAAAGKARDGHCDKGEFCYYYERNRKGSVSDFSESMIDYKAKQPTCYEFRGAGAGRGTCVKNHAASVWNRTGKTVGVYFDRHLSGSRQDFKTGARGDLNSRLFKENASHEIGPKKRTPMPRALYEHGGGRISCGFDGYSTTAGRHEGIDVAWKVGAKVHALVDGKVISVVRGRTGRAGGTLSTIAVYNARYKKTVIYLHTAPLGSLHAGDSVKKGQTIATESWHGVSTRGAAHTHVEMRPGRHTQASKSVGDKHLDNPAPFQFWLDRGYDDFD